MGECGLVGAHSRRKWRRGRPDTAPAPDLLNRDFTSERSDQRWVADISEFKCRDGKLFLAGIKDLHDQGLAGWSMANVRPPTSSSTRWSWHWLAASPAPTSCTTPIAAANTPRSSSRT